MFCKSLLESAVAAPRQRGIRLRATPSCTQHRAAYDIEPLACQAIPAIRLFLSLDARYIFYGTRQIALGQGDPLHEHGFFRTSFGHL